MKTFKRIHSTHDLFGIYKFKDLNTGKITPEKYFMNSYAEEIFESEHAHTYTKGLSTILDAKYRKED